jgi:hypothetical protein
MSETHKTGLILYVEMPDGSIESTGITVYVHAEESGLLTKLRIEHSQSLMLARATHKITKKHLAQRIEA